MTTTPTRPAPQDRKRATRTAGSKAQSKAKEDLALNQGIAVTDTDGTRLTVKVRDVKGIHDADLMAATGMDFMGLLEAMTKRRGMDLFAAALWFARIVNGRESESYRDLLTTFGVEDFIALDMDKAEAGETGPKASAASS